MKINVLILYVNVLKTLMWNFISNMPFGYADLLTINFEILSKKTNFGLERIWIGLDCDIQLDYMNLQHKINW